MSPLVIHAMKQDNTMSPNRFNASRRPGLRSLVCMLASAALALAPLGTAWAQPQYAAGTCALVPNSKTCIDSTPCKSDSSGASVCLAGVPVPKGGVGMTQTCWQYAYQYACAAQAVNTCTSYQTNPDCSVLTSQCKDTDPTTGKCTEFQYSYQCMTQAAVTTKQPVCTSGLFDTAQMPTPAVSNATFGQAAVMQEMLREAQVYSQQGKELFAGVEETCRKGYAGIQNCCKSTPGGHTNAAVAQVAFGAAASVTKYAGAQAIDWASPYVFDAMYNNGIFSEALMDSFSTGADTLGTSLASSGFSVGAFGFTASTGAFEAGQGLFGADTQLLSFDGGGYMAFNPYVFAASIAIMVIQNLASCSNAEQLLAMHKGSNLSVFERSECSSRVLGACVGYTDTYCSFNSVLAKIINTQGRLQLGMDPQKCNGFTTDQINQIDFTKIDFSEFLSSLQGQATAGLPNREQLSSTYQSALTGVTGGSAQTGNMANGSNIVGGSKPTTKPPANPNLPGYPGD